MFTSTHTTRHTVCGAVLAIVVCGSLAPAALADRCRDSLEISSGQLENGDAAGAIVCPVNAERASRGVRAFLPDSDVASTALLAGSVGPRAEARPTADSPARAAVKPCVPARGLVVPVTIRRNLKNGSEVTEPLSGDGYRITRCDAQGRTTVSMTVLPLVDTGGKIVLLPAVTVRPNRSSPRPTATRSAIRATALSFAAPWPSCWPACSRRRPGVPAVIPTS